MIHLKLKVVLVLALTSFWAGELWSQSNAETQITDLKNGVLLVRLSTNEPSIKALRERGFNERADELEKTTLLKNLSWVQAFRKEFTFCPAYFFYSSDTELIKAGKLDQVVFLDDRLEPTSLTPAAETPFLIGDITNIDSEGSNVNFEALIIKDSDFHQLKRPFPFYVRTFNSLAFLKRRPHKVVRKMNFNLREFYEN